MFNLRLKQAETALRDGRLDEAASLLAEPELREHRDGQALITQLVAALVERATEHHAAGRSTAARQDAQQAQQFGGNATGIAALLTELDQAAAQSERQRRREQNLLGEAQREVDAGNCDLGAQLLLQAAADDSAAERLGDQLAVKRSRIAAAADRAEQLVASGRTHDAVSAVAELHALSPQHTALSNLVDRVTGPVVEQIQSEIAAGRLDRVQALMGRVRPLVSLDPDLAEFDQVVALGQTASRSFEQSRFDDALKSLRQLRTLLPDTAWLQTLQEQAQQAALLAAELQASPLSLLGSRPSQPAPTPRIEVRPVTPIVSSASHSSSLHTTGQPLLLQIDGGGSALLLTASSLSIGAAGSSSRCDIPLTGFSGQAPALLTRQRNGYQVAASGDCSVNGVPCHEKLLPAEAKLAFGPRCSLRFRRPAAVSQSAVLDLTGTRLSRPDIRTVVMFDETLIAGAASTSHIVNRSLEQPLVLFQRDDRYFVRSGFAARGAGQDPIVPFPVEPGESVDVAGVRLRLSPVEL